MNLYHVTLYHVTLYHVAFDAYFFHLFRYAPLVE